MAKLLKSIENEGGGRLRGVGDVGPERESSLPRKA